MSLPAGSRLGSYEILAPLGAGGMGEVYRAKDTRLGREVAIKVLPAELSSDAGRLKRFEREARAASALNHPGIVTIYEIGLAEGTSYIAMELVSGKTLRELLLSGTLPVKKLLQIAAPLAEGLAAAHEAGIVHRDLKPENVMATKDGVVKILDFGLAKLSAMGSGEESLPTVTATQPGGLLGTVSYMSPEQAAGQPADFRSDQFSYGSILYELASGTKAFARDTAVDTLSAILHEEPGNVALARPDLPVPLVWVIERCLSKDPAGRYASTRDLARDLATLRERSSEGGLTLAPAARPAAPRAAALRRWLFAAALLAAGVLASRLLWKSVPASPPTFRRLTFRRGTVGAARFTPDGQNVVYSAKWNGEPGRLYLMRPDGNTSLPLSFPDDTGLLAISRDGEVGVNLPNGSFAIAPLTGGAPREITDGVQAADWSPRTNQLAVARNEKLEFPQGKVLYEGVDHIRVSPRGDRIAFGWSHVVNDRLEPVISVVDLSGKRTDIGRGQRNMALVWSPDGAEVWFAFGSGWGNADTILAASLSGHTRVAMRVPGFNVLQDFSRDGRLLLVTGQIREEAWWLPAGESVEREAGWFGGSHGDQLSADGRALLLNEFGEGGGFGTAYLRRADGSPAVKLTDGIADALSPDAKWIACRRHDRILVIPTGPGETRTIRSDRLEYGAEVEFFPDSRRVVFTANEKGRPGRLFVQDVAGGPPRPLTPEGVEGHPSVSPDGTLVAVSAEDGLWIYPADGGERRAIGGLLKGEEFLGWVEGSRSVYAVLPGTPMRVSRVDIATGRREPWKTIGPADPTGVTSVNLRIAPNGAYALTIARSLSDLYLVEGLK